MIYLKTDEEIELLRESNLLVGQTLGELAKWVAPGVTTLQLDRIAEEFIRDHQALPGFLGYAGYPNTLCVSVNEQIVHGIPSDYVLKEGDIVSIDCGVVKNGFNGDSAYTFPVGEVDGRTRQLLDVTKESLYRGIAAAVAGARVGDIGYAVQTYAESFGFSVVRELEGHGIGKGMHENPGIPNYGRPGKGPRLFEGEVICIEPMINAGGKAVYLDRNGWAVHTADHRKSAHFELTVVVRRGRAEQLSTFDFIEKDGTIKF